MKKNHYKNVVEKNWYKMYKVDMFKNKTPPWLLLSVCAFS